MIPIYIKMAAIALWCNHAMVINENILTSFDDGQCRRELFNCLQGAVNNTQAESCFMGGRGKKK